MLGLQLVEVVSIAAWAAVGSSIMLKIVQKSVGLRFTLEEELLGSNIVEHSVGIVQCVYRIADLSQVALFSANHYILPHLTLI